MTRRTTAALWVGWGLALTGGAALFLGLVLALGDECVDAATAAMAPGCDGLPPLVVALTLGGTVVAVVCGILATLVALRGGDRGRR